uniref:Uncharacterized protein n=1 Tax=Helianthus annuus TaxID=4232 RepID=A0A251TS05_HELAN
MNSGMNQQNSCGLYNVTSYVKGKSVKEMVDEALRHVPNHDGDKNIDQLSWATIAQLSANHKYDFRSFKQGEIPSTGSLVEVFNKKILERCLKLYVDSM